MLDIFRIADAQLQSNDAAGAGAENRSFLEAERFDDGYDVAGGLRGVGDHRLLYGTVRVSSSVVGGGGEVLAQLGKGRVEADAAVGSWGYEDEERAGALVPDVEVCAICFDGLVCGVESWRHGASWWERVEGGGRSGKLMDSIKLRRERCKYMDTKDDIMTPPEGNTT